MTLSPRAKLALLAALFLAADRGVALRVLRFVHPEPTANYGELLLPAGARPDDWLARAGDEPFTLRGSIRDKWSWSRPTAARARGACLDKL